MQLGRKNIANVQPSKCSLGLLKQPGPSLFLTTAWLRSLPPDFLHYPRRNGVSKFYFWCFALASLARSPAPLDHWNSQRLDDAHYSVPHRIKVLRKTTIRRAQNHQSTTSAYIINGIYLLQFWPNFNMRRCDHKQFTKKMYKSFIFEQESISISMLLTDNKHQLGWVADQGWR
jgi:hypothetical protein